MFSWVYTLWHWAGANLRRQAPANAGYVVRTPAMSILFGLACCYLGFGSGLFHASLTRWGQQLDVAAMYSPLVVFIAINVGRWVPRFNKDGGPASVPTWPMLAGLALVTSFLLYEYKWSMRSSLVLPTLILIVAAFAVIDRFQRRRKLSVPLMLLSLAALVAARICWVMDVKGSFSGPDAWLQGHAVWHVLTALSLAAIYLYYRNEEPSNSSFPTACLKPAHSGGRASSRAQTSSENNRNRCSRGTRSQGSRGRSPSLGLLAAALLAVPFLSAAAEKYEPNWKSLDARPIPGWFDEAKFGIFIHWGVYSVPAWGPKGSYAEWYWDAMQNKNGATWKFHTKTYGPNFKYQDFAPGSPPNCSSRTSGRTSSCGRAPATWS